MVKEIPLTISIVMLLLISACNNESNNENYTIKAGPLTDDGTGQLLLASHHEIKSRIIDTATDGDFVYTIINSQGTSDTVGDMLIIDTLAGGQAYESDFLDLQPWKVEVADVDGDGDRELVMGVRKRTHFDRVVRNRLFVLRFDGEKLVKKWTGSDIAGDWDDYIVGKWLPIPGEQVLFIERLDGGGERVQAYYWFEFGFQQVAVSERFDKIKRIEIAGDNRLHVVVMENGRQEEQVLKAVDGRMVRESM